MNVLIALLSGFCAVLYTSALPAAETQVYKHVDAQGNITYSDQPPPGRAGVQPERLPQIIIAPAVAVPSPQVAQSEADDPVPPVTLSIQTPAQNATIPAGQHAFAVVARASRPLRASEVARLLIDGAEYARSTSLNWQVVDLERGTHQLGVELLDAKGEPLAHSAAVTIHVHRPIVRSP
ncbi:MAG: DUF4124 domain-containing protein [Cellvibrionales bacterium]|nr:DUF4124 domain-containing protein [Cellvibrionales bacterium]